MIRAAATGTFSSRAVARKLEEDVAFRMLAAGNFPQHRTVCEFRRRHLAQFSELFVGVVQVAREMGLARFGKLLIDGTKVRANASKRKAMSYERMGQEEARLQAEIEALLRKAGAVDAEEDERWGEAFRGDELPEELQRREKRLAAIQAAKARLEAAQRARDDERGREPGQDRHPRGGRPCKRAYGEPEPKAQSNFTDPESPIMKTSSEGFQQCYNAQMAVDGEHQIIVATRVGSQANDQGQLVGLLDGIDRTFGVEPAVVLADAGYCNEPDLLELEDRGIDAHVALGREGKSQVAVDPTRLPATHRMGENLASLRGQGPVRATQVALGGAERVGQGGAWIPTIQPARLGEGARRVGSGVLGVEHQANGDAGHVLRQVLACQRTGSGARSAHRPRMKHQSLAFRPSGLGVPSQSRTGHISTLGPRSHLSNGRATIAHHQYFYGARS